MSHMTESSTQLDAVMVDGGQVWLRKDVREEARSVGDGGAEVKAYVADEVTLFDPAITESYAREHFDELWTRAEREAMTDRQLAGDAIGATDDNAGALADLARVVSDQADDSGAAQGALADLAKTVSDLSAQVETIKAKIGV